MLLGEEDGAIVDGTVGKILEGDTDGLSEDGSAVGTSVTGYVGVKEDTYDGILLGDRVGVVVGSAVIG